METPTTRHAQILDAAWQRRRVLYIGCARKLAARPEVYDEVRRFLSHAITDGSESRRANAMEWQTLIVGRDAHSVSEMILGWLLPDPGRGAQGGELDRLLSNCPLAAIADEQIRSNAGFAPQKQTLLV